MSVVVTSKPGCLLDKAFQRIPTQRANRAIQDLGAAGDDFVYALRTDYVSLSSLFDPESGTAVALRSTVAPDHFTGESCDERKRGCCPLNACLSGLMASQDDMALFLYDAVMQSYRTWLINRWVYGVSKLSLKISNAIHGLDWRELDVYQTKAKEMVHDALGIRDAMQFFIGVADMMLVTQKELQQEYRTRWAIRIEEGKDIKHDGGNIAGSSCGNLEFLNTCIDNYNWNEAHEVIADITELNPARVYSLAFMAVRFNKRRAQKKDVTIKLRDMSDLKTLEVSEEIQFELFRVLHELITNAIKYSHPSWKRKSFVWVEAILEGNKVMFCVKDNGVGIKDVDFVLKKGNRERPELDSGDGRGLSSIKKRAKNLVGISIFYLKGRIKVRR